MFRATVKHPDHPAAMRSFFWGISRCRCRRHVSIPLRFHLSAQNAFEYTHFPLNLNQIAHLSTSRNVLLTGISYYFDILWVLAFQRSDQCPRRGAFTHIHTHLRHALAFCTRVIVRALAGLPHPFKRQRKESRKRKRKRSELNQGELDAEVYHKKVRLFVLEGTQSLLETGRHCGYLTEDLLTVLPKQMSVHECQLAALCDMAKQMLQMENSDAPLVQTVNGYADMDAHLDLFSCLTENPDDFAREVTLMGETYFLPPQSRFLLSDVTCLQPLIRSGDKYDLIVLDPPWENKSVKRSSRYSFLPSSQLKQLPVPGLSAAGCVVVTWVTNRPRHLRFIKEELYPHWGVKLLAEWLWVKVTQKGEVVFPLDSPHKKPYEVLLLGRLCANSDSTTRPQEYEIPEQRLIISVPSTLHSQKPALSAVLKPYIKSNAKCLEMFARSLQPGWTSWGNEVLKFQHHSYFTTESVECDT